MNPEQEKQLEKLTKLFEKGIITEDQYYQKRRELYGLSAPTPPLKTFKMPFKVKWWHILLAILAIAYLTGPKNDPPKTTETAEVSSILFDDVDKTISLMEETGVGDFYRYNCGNSGTCAAFIGSRPEPKEDHNATSMSIEGSEKQVDRIIISCLVMSNTKNKTGTRSHLRNITQKAISILGGTTEVANLLLTSSQNNLSVGPYRASSEVVDDTYKITISR